MGGHIVMKDPKGFKPRLPVWTATHFDIVRTLPRILCLDHCPLATDRRHPIDYGHGLPDSVTVAQQILVLFVQVRILVG